MDARRVALVTLQLLCAALTGAMLGLTLGWWGVPLGFFGFLLLLRLPYYNDRR